MCIIRWGLLAGLLVGAGAVPESPPAKVEVKAAKYADLAGTIRRHLGQVVLVDFWSTT